MAGSGLAIDGIDVDSRYRKPDSFSGTSYQYEESGDVIYG